ncbi:hypothetical protein P280DRAFT_24386 [Massarina eburnea CBS 473.64]|uniref:Complex I intermediate-associated protein-like protein 84 n=1 Tax=Massarina eburnea CBS 473.64 TaxID=1395130 RepID=A0A6A6RYX0_9PLEO|nr:hypothetical protein P280DRAFT_24386 [Massarina eburnea CBS 473.64]
MPLTRLVFRSLLAGTPLFYRGCVHRIPPARTALALVHGRPLPFAAPQRRAFFELFKPRRKIKPAEVPPGLELMGELAQLQRDALRPPRPTDIAHALKAFFAQKRRRFEDFHIQVAHNAFRYLLENGRDDGQPWFPPQELVNMLDKLKERPHHSSGAPHLAMGRLLDGELKRILQIGQQEESPQARDEYEKTGLPRLLRLLTGNGASLEARDVVIDVYGPRLTSPAQPDAAVWEAVGLAWGLVLRGLVLEEKQKELLATLEMMPALSIPYSPNMQNTIVTYFASKNQLQEAKEWYLKPTLSANGATAQKPRGSTLGKLLKACALHGDQAFGQEVVTLLLAQQMGKETWDAVFLWSAAIGKGADEVDRMMNVMVRRNNEDRQKNPNLPVMQPDIDTINTLVEFSMSKKDSYMAERFVTLGEKRGIFPNEKTYTMQMHYRLSIQDIDGARAAYFGLQGSMSDSEESVAAVNALINAMCQSQQHHFDDTMALVDDLHERKARLAPETVAALSLLHLRRGEAHDAVDILQMHAHTFSPEQRVIIRKNLVAFIMDGQTSTADAWDTYQIMRNIFPETPRRDRIPILNEFFARKRSDMACHVFFHMRNASHEDITTTREVYVAAFTGFARNADVESLELAHNQLKLDLNVELNTQLRNALMLAYAATGDNGRALEFWTEIGTSKEGPTYNSIAIAFRSCEGMPFGDQHAKSIWRRLNEMDVDIDKKIFTAYLGAIARNQLYDEAIALVESAQDEYGFTPDLYILGNLFNATTNIDRQAKLEKWIKDNYPSVWREIDALGFWVTMDGFGYRQYNFNRDLDP